jgi:hypothetical protein
MRFWLLLRQRRAGLGAAVKAKHADPTRASVQFRYSAALVDHIPAAQHVQRIALKNPTSARIWSF